MVRTIKLGSEIERKALADIESAMCSSTPYNSPCSQTSPELDRPALMAYVFIKNCIFRLPPRQQALMIQTR